MAPPFPGTATRSIFGSAKSTPSELLHEVHSLPGDGNCVAKEIDVLGDCPDCHYSAVAASSLSRTPPLDIE